MTAIGLRYLVCAFVFMALPCQAALAKDWPKTSGWDIFEADEYCGMTLEYEGKGDTTLSIGKRLDGHAVVAVTNYGWSIKEGQSYDLTFQVGDETFGGGNATGISGSSGRPGFVTSFDASFFGTLAKGKSIRIFRGATLVDDLSLVGSSAAGAVLDRCVAHLRAVHDAAEKERNRFAHIPDDPFASPTVANGAPRGAPAAWISADDYPASAIRTGETGTVTVDLQVDPTGRVGDCAVTASSGSAALDDATCRALKRRARYEPSAGAQGQASPRTVPYTYKWVLPAN